MAHLLADAWGLYSAQPLAQKTASQIETETFKK